MKTLLIPVGIVGCGKTELAILLQSYVSVVHLRDEMVPAGMKKKNAFVEAIMDEFNYSDSVFADRYNHLPQHRKHLITTFQSIYPSSRILILDWMVDTVDSPDLAEMCRLNIIARPDVGQRLKQSSANLDLVISQFIQEYRAFHESEGDCEVIEMEADVNAEENLIRVLDALDVEWLVPYEAVDLDV